MLIGLGIWLLWCLMHERVHGAPLSGEHARERHGSFLVGMAHGLAGTAPLLGVLPVVFIEPIEAALLFLFLFSIGTIAAMALFAGLAGFLLGAAGRGAPGLALTLRFGAALGSVVLGAVWIGSV